MVTSELYRHNEDFIVPQTVLLIGNGAIDNGWAPCARALQTKAFSPELNKNSLDISKTLAIHSFSFRNSRSLYLQDTVQNPNYGAFKEFGEYDLITPTEFRKKLGHEFLIDSNLKLKNQTNIDNLLNPKVGTITLNWDNVLWSMPDKFPNLIHLHGRCEHPQSLILPTELSTDEDIFDLYLNSELRKNNPHIESLFKSYFRGEFRQKLLEVHDLSKTWLAHSDELIIWGVAFNIYDAELMNVIRSFQSSPHKRKKVTIINPCPSHRNDAASILNVDTADRTDIQV